jgi:hypothetical protein
MSPKKQQCGRQQALTEAEVAERFCSRLADWQGQKASAEAGGCFSLFLLCGSCCSSRSGPKALMSPISGQRMGRTTWGGNAGQREAADPRLRP